MQGKGPTPKAVERPKHPAARKAAAATRRSTVGTGRRGGTRRSGGKSATSEWVFGRNAVVEALRAGIPVTTMYVASRIDTDDRVREALKAAVAQGFPLIETQRVELDRLSDGGVHQGLAHPGAGVRVRPPAATCSKAADEAGEPALIIALDGVTDPRNLGAIVRSAGAFGSHGVLVPERGRPASPRRPGRSRRVRRPGCRWPGPAT